MNKSCRREKLTVEAVVEVDAVVEVEGPSVLVVTVEEACERDVSSARVGSLKDADRGGCRRRGSRSRDGGSRRRGRSSSRRSVLEESKVSEALEAVRQLAHRGSRRQRSRCRRPDADAIPSARESSLALAPTSIFTATDRDLVNRALVNASLSAADSRSRAKHRAVGQARGS